MSSENGNGEDIIKIGRKGLKKFQYAEDTPVVTLDVIHVYNQWLALERVFRNEQGVVPPEKNPEVNAALNEFSCNMLQAKDGMSDADALHFQAVLFKEVDKLTAFFDVKSADEPSSPPSSTTLVFSE